MKLLYYIWNLKAETRKQICNKLKRYAESELTEIEIKEIDFHRTNDYLKYYVYGTS